MIDHEILISGPANPDVSKHVISCSVQQSIENDSDPGKIEVVLANVDQMYTGVFVPQVDTMVVTLRNFVYSAEREWLVATGKVTDATSPIEEITVKGECDLGHLADYLPRDFDFKETTCKQALETILASHDTDIELRFEIADRTVRPLTYTSEYTYQAVLEDIRIILGAVFYFDEKNVLVFRDPKAITSYVDLDPFVSKPTQSKSIMGYCNAVTVIGYDSLENDDEGFPTARHMPIQAWYPSQDGGKHVDMEDEDIAREGLIIATPHQAYNIHNQDEAFGAAEMLHEFYQQKKDTLTEVVVEGIIPPLQSLVKYTSFEDPDGGETPKKLYGVVIEKKVEYSIEGLTTTVILHPRDNVQAVVNDIAALLGEQDDRLADPTTLPVNLMTDSEGNIFSQFMDWMNGADWDSVTWGQ